MNENTHITIVTNALATDQRSMIGYGKLVINAAKSYSESTIEFRPLSTLENFAKRCYPGGRVEKFSRNIDRILLTSVLAISKRTDVAHVVDPGNAIYLSMMRQRASIVTVHDMIPYLCLRGKLDGFEPSRTGRWLMERILSRLRKVDRIVCVSQSTKEDLLSIIDVVPSNVVVIPNAVFQPMTQANSESCHLMRRQLGLSSDAKVVLHVGRNFYKNRAVVIEAFARLHSRNQDTWLIMVGALTPELERKVECLGIGSVTTVISRVEEKDMPVLYSLASLLLFPSLYEGFGYPVLEAQLCGTPVVCSNSGSLAEVAGEGAVLVSPHDVEGMADAAEDIIEHALVARNLVEKGFLNTQKYTVEKWVQAHQSLYSDVLSQL